MRGYNTKNNNKECEKKCRQEYRDNNEIARQEYLTKLLENKEFLKECLEACKKK